jgi:1-acyl-sn-glycerol-3-phosphate acyltransferase
MNKLLLDIQQSALMGLVRVVAGCYPRWREGAGTSGQTIYFANHTSNADTLALMAALPAPLRRKVKPVAALDYWGGSDLRRHIATQVLNAVLIDRKRATGEDPLTPVRAALEEGHSIIIFPEGKRNQDTVPGLFKSGLYHLACEFPDVALSPVYLENLYRIMPKGQVVPVPLISKVHFGPLIDGPGELEEKGHFLERARHAIITLAAEAHDE